MLGLTDGRILVLVLAESLILPVLAGGLGLAAWAFIQRSNPMGGVLPMPPLSVPNIAFGALMAVLLGVIAAVMPTWRVRNLSVVDALRREG
jgi:putative ABC transport system permease protein